MKKKTVPDAFTLVLADIREMAEKCRTTARLSTLSTSHAKDLTCAERQMLTDRARVARIQLFTLAEVALKIVERKAFKEF